MKVLHSSSTETTCNVLQADGIGITSNNTQFCERKRNQQWRVRLRCVVLCSSDNGHVWLYTWNPSMYGMSHAMHFVHFDGILRTTRKYHTLQRWWSLNNYEKGGSDQSIISVCVVKWRIISSQPVWALISLYIEGRKTSPTFANKISRLSEILTTHVEPGGGKRFWGYFPMKTARTERNSIWIAWFYANFQKTL